jgi:hypothetical protein
MLKSKLLYKYFPDDIKIKKKYEKYNKKRLPSRINRAEEEDEEKNNKE